MRFFYVLIKSNTFRVLLGLSALLLATTSMAAEQVRVEEVSGQVQFRSNASEVWQEAKAGMSVPAPVEFQTLAGGYGLLAQAGSEFELKGGSHIALQAGAAEPEGLVTKVKQWFGTVFYRIERQPDQFSVETPFLVSTVKGTRFVIVSTQSSSTVTLTEGSLEVLDIATGSVQMLEPGDIAGIGAEQAGIQSFKQAPQKAASAAGAEISAFQPAMDDTQNSFESALEAMTEVASEQTLIAADSSDMNQNTDGGSDAGPDSNDGAEDDGSSGGGNDDGDTGGGGADDGSGDDMGGGHGNGNGHNGHNHDDDDDDDDDD